MMEADKIITIISPNTLVCLGLKSILSEYFSVSTIFITKCFEEYQSNDHEKSSDLIFLSPEIYVLNEYFQGIKAKLIIMLERNEKIFENQTSLTFLNISHSQSEIIDNLNSIFDAKIKAKYPENHEDLSMRETEVLRLVSLGLMNKQIADNLNISMHTVISHRKNLTRKLGINTVSGLTVYALLNGLITYDDLNNINIQNPDKNI